MGKSREELINLFWRGQDPFLAFPKNVYQVDDQGWGQHHHYLMEAIKPVNDQVVVEIGVWKGASSIKMAQRMKELGVRGTVISVDTWLGAADHWTQEWFHELGWEHGWPNLQRKFMANVIAAGVQDYIVPLPVDSINAAEVLRHFNVEADVIHIDAGHEYRSVISDLHAWWPVLRAGGHYIGDDYYDMGTEWPGVQQAHDEFFGERGLSPFEYVNGKCRLDKPTT